MKSSVRHVDRSRLQTRATLLAGIACLAMLPAQRGVADSGLAEVDYLADASLSQPGGDPEPPANGSPEYVIGASDVLVVNVRGIAEASASVAVRPDGRITLPLVGDAKAVGKTPEALAEDLEQAFAEYVQDPVVTVTVAEPTGTFDDRIRVIGEGLEAPRSFAFRRGMTVMDVVLELDELPSYAATHDAYLIRGEGEERETIPLRIDQLREAGDTRANLPLAPGDTIVVPQGFFTGDWTFSQFANVSQTYTDNVDLDPKGEEQSALITRVGPGFAIQGDTARIQAALTADIFFVRQSLSEPDNRVEGDVAGNGTFTWVENRFFTDVAASVSQQTLDNERGISASDANTSNRQTVQSYRVSPYLVHRLGRLVRLEARYAGNITFIDQSGDEDDDNQFADDEPSDSIEHTLALTASSGPRFERYSWTLTGRATELDLDENGDDPTTDESDQSRREVILRNEYAISREFDLIADVGYQKLETDDEEDDFEEPLYRGGFRWTPSPDTTVFAVGGKADGGTSVTAELSHDFSPVSNFTLTFDEVVASSQQRLAANLPESPEDVDDFDPQLDRFTIRDETTRTETLRGIFTTELGRNELRLDGSYQREQEDITGGGDTSERSFDVGLQLSRPITRNVRVSAEGRYLHSTFIDVDDGGGDVTDDDYQASLRLTYTALEDMDLSLEYAFSRRDSTRESDEFTENAVTVGARYRF